MEIWIDSANESRLHHPDDFTAFAVVVRSSTAEKAAPALRALGAFAGEHVFVDQTWLIEHAGAAADNPSWRSGFDAMVAYAASKGWLDGAGRIRAHIRVENAPTAPDSTN